MAIFSSFDLIGNQDVREVLKTISEDELETLQELFYDLFNRGNFCYTLFGQKPMSLTAHFITSFDREGMPTERGIGFWKKWNIWKKYAKAFPTPHYLLIEGFDEKNDSKEIYFINKKYFIKKVDEHLKLFQKAFGNDITGNILLNKIEKNHKLLSFLKHYQTLLGILLGYGEHNARLFDKRNQISPFIYKKEFPKIPNKIPNPSERFSSLLEEFNAYFSLLTLFGDPEYSPLVIHSVHFVADHKHPETIELQQKYRKMRGEISIIYSKGDFLEITLTKLTEE